MHGREVEERKRRRLMLLVPALSTTTVAADSTTSPVDSFCKDGRKISVGDCALFKPPQEFPPFIGIIRCLTSGKEDNLKLVVNWLYRPAEVKLGKGILLEAAPNEVFYSFHKDEIPAASLLHPCKVAFLRKGVELPSGISSFVCRRVYDIANKCLWWLTDQDYINERQEEVDQLLDKTRLEMHAAVQSGGRSPKPLNGPSSIQQLKPGSDSVQNSTSPLPSQGKGKRRDWGDQGSEPVKRERSLKADEADSSYSRQESMLKSEIAKITEKGGFVNPEGVEKLVQLMQPERFVNRIDLSGRIMLADVIAATDRFDCLVRFVQLKGLSVLNEWLQEVHKGKIGDGGSPKENDKSVDEFLLALLRALDKLPVNLNALQTCNVGKSVNCLRSHKNLEIQKKARSLVDTWKKRVEAEMKINDAKSGSSQAVSWPNKPDFPEIPHVGNKRTVGSSEVAIKSSITQPSASKTTPVKVGQGEAAVKSVSASPASVKISGSLPVYFGINSKDPRSKMAVGGGSADMPLTTREEKSSSSSQSQNNSQSCLSDHAKTFGSSWKEDARSSTTGSVNVNKISSGTSRHRKSSNGYVGSAVSAIQKETGLSKCGSKNRNLTSEKVAQPGSTCERGSDFPLVDHGNSDRLIVRLPNPGCSPARSVSGGSIEDTSFTGSRASSPGHSEKQDHDRKVKGKSEACRENNVSDVNNESWQSNDVKDGVAMSDEGDRSPAAVLDEESCRTADESGKLTEASKVTFSSSGNDPKPGKSYEASFSSINAFIESCVKYSEASASIPIGDDVGMNLLASVAAGEMSKSDMALPIDSLKMNSPALEDSCLAKDGNLGFLHEDIVARNHGRPDIDVGGVDTGKQANIVNSLHVKDGLGLTARALTSPSGDKKCTSSLSEEKNEHTDDLHSFSLELQRITDPCLKYGGKPNEITASTSGVASPAETKEEGPESEGANQVLERKACANADALNVRSPLFDDNKKVDRTDEKITESSVTMTSDAVRGSTGDKCDNGNAGLTVKIEKEAVEESSSCPSFEINGEKKVTLQECLSGDVSTEQKPPLSKNCLDSEEGSGEDAVLPSASGKVLDADNVNGFKAEKTDDVGAWSHVEHSERQEELASSIPITGDERVGTCLGPSASDYNNEGFEEKTGRKDEVLEHQSGRSTPQEELLASPVRETEQCINSGENKLIVVEANETEECVSTVDASSLCIAAGSDVAAKVDFDLNEGFPADDGNEGEPANSEALQCSSVHLPCPVSFPLSSISSGIPASVTVAAAAKGPFVPLENLLRSKGELGWKGSAATSAFRPAEPRKVLEMPLCTPDTHLPDIAAGKQGRIALDIDLNVADERFIEDMASQSSAHKRGSEAGLIKNRDVARGEMFVSTAARVRSVGGLDLDLNRVDEGTDIGKFPVSTSQRLEVHLFAVSSSSSGGFPNSEVNVLRDFDLNNGPVVDEMGTEPALHNHHTKNSMPFLAPVTGVRMNSTELGNLSSWYPPGNSYSAVSIPSILPDRGVQPYPFLATAGPQRILGPPPGGSTFGPDIYRGPVLSSSPAAAFPSAAPFQYAGFPFGTNFPLPSTSFSGGSTGYDSSSGGALCFPAVPSPLVGPAGAMSSQYHRPYVISLSDATSNGVAESSRKWVRQGLDLNAGPGGTDEGRDDRISSTSRQLSVASSQALVEEQARMYQAAGVLKRKEPEGGWDAERFSYRQQHSWR